MQDPQLTHHIQLGILRQMLKASESRYSDLKPKAIESNLFMYHLKQLIREGLIEKREKVYALTRDGKRFADRATLETMRIRVQPKVVSILCVRRSDEKWLLLQRKHQPFNGYKGFPSGKLHYGESLQAAAARELYEKAGITDVELTLRGNVLLRFMDGIEPVNHVIGYVFYGEVPQSTIADLDTEHFYSYFGDESQLYEAPCFKGHQEILHYLSANRLFIEEAEFDSDY